MWSHPPVVIDLPTPDTRAALTMVWARRCLRTCRARRANDAHVTLLACRALSANSGHVRRADGAAGAQEFAHLPRASSASLRGFL